jgi:hypothetical protein
MAMPEILIYESTPFWFCEIVLEKYPEKKFGGTEVEKGNTSKKVVQKMAAKEAVLWLRSEGLMSEVDSKPTAKAKRTNMEITVDEIRNMANAPKASANTLQNTEKSAAAQVVSTYCSSFNQGLDMQLIFSLVGLCNLLGLQPPQYTLIQSAHTPRGEVFWNGYATFSHAPELDGPIGQVDSVCGKKTAKEEISKNVVERLQKLEADRVARFKRGRGSLLPQESSKD